MNKYIKIGSGILIFILIIYLISRTFNILKFVIAIVLFLVVFLFLQWKSHGEYEYDDDTDDGNIIEVIKSKFSKSQSTSHVNNRRNRDRKDRDLSNLPGMKKIKYDNEYEETSETYDEDTDEYDNIDIDEEMNSEYYSSKESSLGGNKNSRNGLDKIKSILNKDNKIDLRGIKKAVSNVIIDDYKHEKTLLNLSLGYKGNLDFKPMASLTLGSNEGSLIQSSKAKKVLYGSILTIPDSEGLTIKLFDGFMVVTRLEDVDFEPSLESVTLEIESPDLTITKVKMNTSYVNITNHSKSNFNFNLNLSSTVSKLEFEAGLTGEEIDIDLGFDTKFDAKPKSRVNPNSDTRDNRRESYSEESDSGYSRYGETSSRYGRYGKTNGYGDIMNESDYNDSEESDRYPNPYKKMNQQDSQKSRYSKYDRFMVDTKVDEEEEEGYQISQKNYSSRIRDL